MIKVGIIGATGYTGVELIRLLSLHAHVQIVAVTSRQHAGTRVDTVFPSLRGFTELEYSSPKEHSFCDCDVVFAATPNGVAMKHARALLDQGIKLIDLSADFRLKDVSLWQHWYGMEHACPELIEQAVYGLPELYRGAIKKAQLIGCAGCYPTASQLAIYPLLKNDLIEPDIVIDAKSGISGAGRGASVDNLLAEASDSIKAYAVNGHRHLPEISQGLQAMSKEQIDLTFVPHLMPMIRGILVTCYAQLKSNVDVDLQQLYGECYQDEPFVDVLDDQQSPQTRSVKGSNLCRINVFRPQDKNKVVVLAAEDNLVKGAAGQAIQCMNIIFGLEEKSGLQVVPLMP